MSSASSHKAILLGAFDRFNYGDLLFPIVAQNELAQHSPDTVTAVHALVESDWSRYGALKTQSLRALYRPGALRDGDAVIFAGGGTIGVDWNHMHANLLGRGGNLALYYLKRLGGTALADGFSRRYFGARAPFPWVAGPEDFPARVKVAYNAVGGSEFARLAPSVQHRTLDRLSRAAYLSVRDGETRRLFAPLEDRIRVELSPDSAILMSEQFPLSWLQQHAESPLPDAPYVCFQSNVNYARQHVSRIVAALEALYEQHGLHALLLPIGRYVGLDDKLALDGILSALRTPAAIVSDQASLWDIMRSIAQSRLFVGTSLHGNVTAQSFAVPHLGLSDCPCKLDYYLASWDLPEQSRCVALDEVCAQAGVALAVPEVLRQQKRGELIGLARENFARLAHACGLAWPRS